MKIIILGAGRVGVSLAHTLVAEGNDVTVVDNKIEKISQLSSRIDCQTVLGEAGSPFILEKAGIESADMLVAVTRDDEVNIVACQISSVLSNTPTKIARLRNPDYTEYQAYPIEKIFPIDCGISPENLVTDTIVDLLHQPGALQVLRFAGGKVLMVAVNPMPSGPLVGKSLAALQEAVPDIGFNLAAIYRDDMPVPLVESSTIKLFDEVFFIAEKNDIKTIMATLRRLDNPYHRVMITGGTTMASLLAKKLENDFDVKFVDSDQARCEMMAKSLLKSTVLNGDPCDPLFLSDENIEAVDVFCALSNDDEDNMIAAMQAKRLGVRKVITVVSRMAYIDLIEGGAVDIVISPHQVTIGSILTFLRKGDIASVHSLRRGAAEVMEIIVHGDSKNSSVIGKQVQQLKLPEAARIGAVIRDGRTIRLTPETIIEADDHVILFLSDKSVVKDVEQLFQVGFSFF